MDGAVASNRSSQPAQQREAAIHGRTVDRRVAGEPAQDIGPFEEVDRADVVLDGVAAQAQAALEMVDRAIGVATSAGGVRRRQEHRPRTPGGH